MNFKVLPNECIAPLYLKSITLNGIGSYFKPATLELKPLIIICGKNGSGKSTWIKALNYLKELADSQCDIAKITSQKLIKKFNPNSALGGRDVEMLDWDDGFGIPPSISVKFIVQKETIFQGLKGLPGHNVDSNQTVLNKNDEIAIRITYFSKKHWSNWLRSGDNEITIGFRMSVNNNGFEVRGVQKENEESGNWSVYSVFDGQSKFHVTDNKLNEKQAWDSLISIIKTWVDGYFYIQAVRPLIEAEEELHSNSDIVMSVNKLPNRRHVGAKGEHTLAMQRYYESNFVLNPWDKNPYIAIDKYLETLLVNPYRGENVIQHPKAFLCRQIGCSELWRLLALSNPGAWSEFVKYILINKTVLKNKIPLTEHIVDAIAEEQLDKQYDKMALAVLDEVERLSVWRSVSNYEHPDENTIYAWFASNDKTVEEPIYNDFQLEWSKLGKALSNQLSDQHSEIALFIVNKILNNKYEKGKDTFYFGKLNFDDTQLAIKMICRLNNKTPWKIHPNDWDIILFGEESDYGESTIHFIQNLWSSILLKAKCNVPNTFDYYPVEDNIKPYEYVGYMFPMDSYFLSSDKSCAAGRLKANGLSDHIYLEEHFSGQTVPTSFSAGFHQVNPLITQFLLMKRNEICAIENPEVHVHPKLQVDIVEYIINNAKIGKWSIIETHSDLIIKRVMRAILNEELPQSWLNIYFCSGETQNINKKRFVSSVINLLAIDEKGRIKNWPEGFLDEGLRESEELLEILYGFKKKPKAQG